MHTKHLQQREQERTKPADQPHQECGESSDHVTTGMPPVRIRSELLIKSVKQGYVGQEGAARYEDTGTLPQASHCSAGDH